MGKKKDLLRYIYSSNVLNETKKQVKGKAKPRGKKQQTVDKHKTKEKKTILDKQHHLKGKTDSNIFRWAIGALCSAVCEHRWDDAFRLLPCVIIRMVKDVPHHFLWRMTDVITRNATGISLSLRQQLRRDICYLNVKAHEIVLDSLSQDLQTADDFEIDNLLQMLDDFSRKKSSNARFYKGTQKRMKYLLDGYVGQVLYYRWKNCQCRKEETHIDEVQDNAVSSYQTADTDWQFMHEIFGSHELTAGDKQQVLAKQAHTAMKNALSNFGEPCEWLMERYLDLEHELYGTEAAVNTLKLYLKKNPDHLPAYRLSYHFYKKNFTDGNENQMEALKEISRMCPDDPLVLEYVDALLRDVEHNKVVVPRRIENIGEDYDSGMDEWEDTGNKLTVDGDEVSLSSTQEKPLCLLKSSVNVQTLETCLNLLTTLLEYKEFVWDLQPWQRLTRILRKFFFAWINCWSCLLCNQSRELVNKVGERVTPLWQYYVWTPVPEKLSLEKANVLIHHIFSAHVFSYSLAYITKARAALHSNRYLTLADELRNILALPGPFVEEFNVYSRHRRQRFDHLEVETYAEHCKEKDAKLSKMLSPQTEEYEQNCIEDNDSHEHVRNSCVETEHGETQNETYPSSLNDERELHCNSKYKVGNLFKSTVKTQSSQSFLDISMTNCNVSFNEHDIFLTSTQVKDENFASLGGVCVAEDPVHNGSFIGYLQRKHSLCMMDARNHEESCQKQKERIHTNEFQNEVECEERNSDDTSSIEIDLPQQQNSEMHVTSNILHTDSKDNQRPFFETENFSSVIDDIQSMSTSCSSDKTQEDENSEDKTVPSGEKRKGRLNKKKRKAKTLISNCPTSPNQEEQNRDLDMNVEEDNYDPISNFPIYPNQEEQNGNLDMNVEEDNYDPQSKYTLRLNYRLESHPKASTSLDIDHNTAKQTSHDSVDPKTIAATFGILREGLEDSHGLKHNHHSILSPGISSKEAGNSLPFGQRQCSSSCNIGEDLQEHGNSPSDDIEMAGNDSVLFQCTPLQKDSDISAFVPGGHKSFVNYNSVVDETLTQLSNYVDDGVCIIPETQSQATKDQRNPLSLETLVGDISKIPCNYNEGKSNLQNIETMHSISQDEIKDTQMEDDTASTLESKSSSRFSLTQGQRVSRLGTQDAQELCSSVKLINGTDFHGFYKTEEYEDDESVYGENCQTGNIFATSGHQPNDFQSHLPCTPAIQVSKMFSDEDTDELNFAKSSFRKNICSLSKKMINESDSENCIGPTQDGVSMPKKHLVHHSMSCNSSSQESIRLRSEDEIDPEIIFDDLYLPLPDKHESYQSPLPYSPRTSVSDRDKINEENVLEVTPLPTLYLKDKELEPLSQPANERDTDCEESLSMSLLAYTSDKSIIKTKDIFPQTRTEGPCKAMIESQIKHLPYRTNKSVSFHPAKDNVSNKTSMDNHFYQNETEGRLLNTLINDDQEKIDSIMFDDGTEENDNHYENIFDSVYITTSDVKSEFEHEYIEKKHLIINRKQNEKQCCKLKTVAETQSKLSTQKKEGVRKRKTDFLENATNSINQDDWAMREYMKYNRNYEKMHYSPDKSDRTYNDNYCEGEDNIMHNSTQKSSVLNRVQKAFSFVKHNARQMEAEITKNAKKKKTSQKVKAVKSVDELRNSVEEVCREIEYQRHSRNEVSNENHKENESWYDYIDDLPFPNCDYSEESGDIQMFDNSEKVIKIRAEVDGCVDGSACDVTEARTRKSYPKSLQKKTNYISSWFEGLPLPGFDVLDDDIANLANRSSPKKSKNCSELLKNKTLEGYQIENEHMKSPQFPVSLNNKTVVEFSVEDGKNECLVDNVMLREKSMEIEKTVKENNDGNINVENDKIINEPVTTTRKRKRKLHQLANDVTMIRCDDYEHSEDDLMVKKKKVQEGKGKTKPTNKIFSAEFENKLKKKKKTHYMLQSQTDVCNVGNNCNTDLDNGSFVLNKRPKKRKADMLKKESIDKLNNIKASESVSVSKAKFKSKLKLLRPEIKETSERNVLPEGKSKEQKSLIEEPKEVSGHLIFSKESRRSDNYQETRMSLKKLRRLQKAHKRMKRKERKLHSKENYDDLSITVIDHVVSKEMKTRNCSGGEKKVIPVDTELPLSDVKIDSIDNYMNSINDSLHLCPIRKKKKKVLKNIKSYGLLDVQETGSQLKKKKKKKPWTDSESYSAVPDIDKVVLSECSKSGVDDMDISEKKIKRKKVYSNEIEKQKVDGYSLTNVTEGKTVYKYKKEMKRKSLQRKLLKKNMIGMKSKIMIM